MKEETPLENAANALTGALFPLNIIAAFIKTNKIFRYILAVIALICFLTTIVLTIYANVAANDKDTKDFILNEVIPATLFPSVFILILFTLSYITTSTDFLSIRLAELRMNKEVITKKIETDQTLNIFNTIQLSLNQLDEYYTINKGQATSSFRASMFSAFIGLLAIILGIWLNYKGNEHITLTFIAGIAGLLLEFIGGAYFFMYKKSLEQVNFFFGQLIKVQDTMLAINLADGILEEDNKVRMQQKIIKSLLERSLK